MQTLFTSDLHLGHKNIYKYRPQFQSSEEHDEAIFSILESLPKRTNLVVVGDFLFDCDQFKDYLHRLSSLPYTIKLIMGNHDSLKLYSQAPSNIHIYSPLYTYKELWVSHCPIHPQEFRGRLGNIHGHLHNDCIKTPIGTSDRRYFNVNLDNNYFKPVSIDTIKSHFKGL